MRDLICLRLCRYYKPGKDEPGCGGVLWLEDRPALRAAVETVAAAPDDELRGLDADDPRLLAVCEACEYRADGCDLRDPAVPRERCHVCGGLQAVAALLAAGRDLEA